MQLEPTPTIEYPWHNEILRSWSICGMNHYYIQGMRHIYVSMTKNNLCITEEGVDTEAIWLSLTAKAKELELAGEIK